MKLRHLSLATATLCLFAGATAASAQSAQLPSDINATSRARLPYVQRKDTDEQAKRLFDIFVRNSNSPTDQLGGPLGVRCVQRPGRQCTARSARWRRGQGHARRARARARDSRRVPRDELRLRVERPRAGGAQGRRRAKGRRRREDERRADGPERSRRRCDPLRPRAAARPRDELGDVREGEAAVRRQGRDGPRRRHEHLCRERLLRDRRRRAPRRRPTDSTAVAAH